MEGRLFGPFLKILLILDIKIKKITNCFGIGIPIQRTWIFVIMREYFDKWREVMDFGFEVTKGMSINDHVFQNLFQFIILGYKIYWQHLLAHAFKLNWANAFKQIRIYHTQLPYFAYDFDGHTFISSMLEFCKCDAPREFSKCFESLMLMIINTLPDFCKKGWSV